MIHPAYNLFLAIYLAHLLTDFVFQTSRLVSKKRRGDWRGYLIHGVTHYVLVLATVALADPHRFPTLTFQLVAVSLSVIPLLVDWAKVSSTKSRLLPDNALVLLLDQAIHLLTVIGAVFFLVHPSVREVRLRSAQ